MEQKKKTPAVRFRGFEKEWKTVELGRIVEMTSSKRVYLDDYVDNGIPFYRGKEITELKQNIEPTEILYISKSKFYEFKKLYGAPKKGDILITAVGTLGNIYRVNNNKEFYFKDGNLIWLKNISCDSFYLNHLLTKSKKKLKETAIGSTQKALTMVALKNIIFNLPNSKPEQSKIGSFFENLDHLLSKHQTQHQKLKALKKAMLGKLFPKQGATVPEIRFKGFTGNWEVKTLGEICDNHDNKRIPVKESLRQKGETPYYGANGVQDFVEGYTHIGEFTLVAEDGANDLLDYPTKYAEGKIWANNHVHVLSGKKNILDTLFLSYKIKSINISKYLVGGGRAKLNGGVMAEIQLTIPKSLKEQQQIGNYFKNLDQLITKHATQIEKLGAIKKACLSKMFV